MKKVSLDQHQTPVGVSLPHLRSSSYIYREPSHMYRQEFYVIIPLRKAVCVGQAETP